MKNRFANHNLNDIKRELDKINVTEGKNSRSRILSYLDLTSLNVTDNENTIHSMVEKVNGFSQQFPDLPVIAGLCVFPRFVSLIKKHLSVPSVKIVSVAASFPFSQTFMDVKVLECEKAVHQGADEIDIVLSVGNFLADEFEQVRNEIIEIKNRIGKAHLKVILETGILEGPEKIYNASMIAMEAGADFIKTSTGKSPVSATPEAAWIMCHAINDYFRETGKMVGIKPAGGISTSPEAHVYYGIVKNVLGNEWLVSDYFRIGASRLANDLLSRINGGDLAYF